MLLLYKLFETDASSFVLFLAAPEPPPPGVPVDQTEKAPVPEALSISAVFICPIMLGASLTSQATVNLRLLVVLGLLQREVL